MKPRTTNDATATSHDAPTLRLATELEDADLDKVAGGYWGDYGGYGDYGYGGYGGDWGYAGYSDWGGGYGATYFVGGGCDAW